MGAITPVSDAEREQIRHRHARGESCTAIAAALGRNPGTITRQCKKMGLKFDRAATKAATDAKVADNRARRALAQEALLDDFARLRERAWKPYEVVIGTGEGAETVELDLPPAEAVRAFYVSMGLCVDKQLAMEKHDAGGDVDTARSLLGRLFTGLAQAVDGEQAETPADDGAA